MIRRTRHGVFSYRNVQPERPVASHRKRASNNMAGSKIILIHLVLTGCWGVVSANMKVELDMPKYARKNGEVTLRCDHNVEPEQLHKVEWLKGGSKIFQYVKGRRPPFRNYTTPGAVIDMKHSNEWYVRLTRLDFAATGFYSCEVSMETPIYTKPSKTHELTVIQPQNYDPVIRFKQPEYQVGEVLEANCTTSPARPPPHITWLINDKKAPEAMTKSFTNGRVQGHGWYDRTSPSITQLAVEVSELHKGENGELTLSCIATIPAFISHNGKYADQRNATVTIKIITIEVTTVEEPEPFSSDACRSDWALLPFLSLYLLYRN